MHRALKLALVCLLGLCIPVVRAEDHQVVVGGIGILKYDPEFVVRIILLLLAPSRADVGPRTPMSETL